MNSISANTLLNEVHSDKIHMDLPQENNDLIEKAREAMDFYGKAMGVEAFAVDSEGFWFNIRCSKFHLDALNESRNKKEIHVYKDSLGNYFWTCPFYDKNSYAGALVAGNIVPGEIYKQDQIQAMSRLLELCAGELTIREELSAFIPKSIVRKKGNINNTETNGQTREEGPDFLAEKERMIFAAFRRGDMETGKKFISEFMEYLLKSFPDNIEIFRLGGIELLVLLSREAANEGEDIKELLDQNNKYLQRIQESENINEIMKYIYLISERIGGKLFSFKGMRHASALRKAERYIWNNYTRKLSLEEIAHASGLSAPYFSTIFKEEIGENLSSYLNRLRVDKASNLLIASKKPLREIAEICGFEDQSWFSKIFKKFTGLSPGKFREKGNRRV